MEHSISLEWSKKMLAAEEGITPAAGPLAMRPFSDPDNTDTMHTKESRPEITEEHYNGI